MDEQTGSDIEVKVRRRSREHVEALVADFRRSGQTLSGYARANGVRLGSLRKWVKGRCAEGKGAARLLPVRVIEPAGSSIEVRVRFANGVSMEFCGPVAASVLVELVRAGGLPRC